MCLCACRMKPGVAWGNQENQEDLGSSKLSGGIFFFLTSHIHNFNAKLNCKEKTFRHYNNKSKCNSWESQEHVEKQLTKRRSQ